MPLEYGVNWYVKRIQSAVEHGETDLLSLELEHVEDAVDIDSARLIVDQIPEYDGMSALMIACCNNDLECATVILSISLDINKTDYLGITALMYASMGSTVDCLRLLLKHNANPNLRDNHGWSALLCCIDNNMYNNARYLLENGANVDLCDVLGRTPLIHALNTRMPIQYINLLLEFSANVNVGDNEKVSPAMWATRTGNFDALRLLIRHGADLTMSDMNGSQARDHNVTNCPKIEALHIGYSDFKFQVD